MSTESTSPLIGHRYTTGDKKVTGGACVVVKEMVVGVNRSELLINKCKGTLEDLLSFSMSTKKDFYICLAIYLLPALWPVELVDHPLHSI